MWGEVCFSPHGLVLAGIRGVMLLTEEANLGEELFSRVCR